MNVEGEAGGAPTTAKRAGAGLKTTGRKALLDLYSNFKEAQDDQNQSKRPMTFSVPSRNLKWDVWLREMRIAWDPTTITYPYAMSFEVAQDFNTGVKQVATSVALDRLAAKVGFSPTYTGFDDTGVTIKFSNLVDAGLFLGN